MLLSKYAFDFFYGNDTKQSLKKLYRTGMEYSIHFKNSYFLDYSFMTLKLPPIHCISAMTPIFINKSGYTQLNQDVLTHNSVMDIMSNVSIWPDPCWIHLKMFSLLLHKDLLVYCRTQKSCLVFDKLTQISPARVTSRDTMIVIINQNVSMKTRLKQTSFEKNFCLEGKVKKR